MELTDSPLQSVSFPCVLFETQKKVEDYVHDIFAAQIIIEDLVIKEGKFTAVIRYNIQDHFGLDNDDILMPHFHQFRFFRIWFVLQRYDRFGCKPFMTNMCARVEISGYEHEKQQTP